MAVKVKKEAIDQHGLLPSLASLLAAATRGRRFSGLWVPQRERGANARLGRTNFTQMWRWEGESQTGKGERCSGTPPPTLRLPSIHTCTETCVAHVCFSGQCAIRVERERGERAAGVLPSEAAALDPLASDFSSGNGSDSEYLKNRCHIGQTGSRSDQHPL